MIPMILIIFGKNISIGFSRQATQPVLFVPLPLTNPIRLIDLRYHGLDFIPQSPPGFAGKMQTRPASCRTCRLPSLPAKYALPRESFR